MHQKEIIRKLVDHILLNSCSVASSGYYNGKAGMALALFEAARYLQDEYIEEQAFNLLKEALLSKTDDITFENGLSGIGYVLLYLIENHFIEANFDELYSEQFEKIIMDLKKIEQQPIQLLMLTRITHFLVSAKKIRSHDKRIYEIVRSTFEANELYLVIQFSNFENINYVNNKNQVIDAFEKYLIAVYNCKYYENLQVVLSNYAKLYRNGRIMSSIKVAYYLEKLDICRQYEDVVENNSLSLTLKDLYTISLKNCIDIEKLTDNNTVLNQLLVGTNEKLEKRILQLIPPDTFKYSYEQGISRLLIYLTNKNYDFL